jgi:hypothetical protein
MRTKDEIQKEIEATRQALWKAEEQVEKSADMKALIRREKALEKKESAIEEQIKELQSRITELFLEKGTYPYYGRDQCFCGIQTNIRDEVLEAIGNHAKISYLTYKQIIELVERMIEQEKKTPKSVEIFQQIGVLKKKAKQFDTYSSPEAKEIEKAKEELTDKATGKIHARFDALEKELKENSIPTAKEIQSDKQFNARNNEQARVSMGMTAIAEKVRKELDGE